MAPPGRPKMTSVCSISRLFIRACAPVNFIGASLSSRWLSSNLLAKQNDLPSGRPFDARVGERARQVSTTEIRIVALAEAWGIAVPATATAMTPIMPQHAYYCN
jgi:hypothetical protein